TAGALAVETVDRHSSRTPAPQDRIEHAPPLSASGRVHEDRVDVLSEGRSKDRARPVCRNVVVDQLQHRRAVGGALADGVIERAVGEAESEAVLRLPKESRVAERRREYEHVVVAAE